jgi:PAS domain S-box-containing protein
MSVHQLKDGRWFVRFYDLLEDDGKNMTNGNDISEHSRLNRQTDTAMEDEINRLHLQNQLIMNTVGEGVVGVDAQGKVIFANIVATAMTGYEADELLGQNLHAMIHHSRPDGTPYPQSSCPMSKSLTDGTVRGIDNEVLWRKDGTSFPAEYLSRPMVENDRISGAVIAFRDITEQQQSKKALEESLSRYKALAESTYAITWEFDIAADQWTYVSPQAKRILGYAPEAWKDREWWMERIHPEDREWVSDFCQKAISQGVEHVFEYRFIAHDGRTVWLYDIVNVEMQDDHPVKTRGVMIDITKRKQTEAALQDSEEKFRSIVAGSLNAVLLTRPDGGILTVNQAACDLFQMTEQELTESGRNAVVDLTDPRLAPALAERERTGKVMAELNLKKKDGTIFPAVVSSSVFSDSKGNQYTSMIIRDISDSKHAEAENIKLHQQLRQAQKMEAIGTLAGGIAHDFNNILTSILGYTDLALGFVEAGSRIKEYLSEVQTASYRAGELVKQILTFARQTENERRPIKVKHIAKEALKLLRASIPASITINQNLECEAVILGDPSQVHQIFMNLCTNAAQAMSDDSGVLTVHLSDVQTETDSIEKNEFLKSGNYLKIIVTDTGIGIPEKDIESIFDPYFTTKGIGEGTGLGLSVVHGIVKSYGGEILVDSEPGRGSTFTVYLPALKKRVEAAPAAPEVLPGGHERILVIDDEAAIARMCHQLLTHYGYQVTIQSSSLEALAIFKNRPADFDLVLTDMTMPDMNGARLAEELKKIRPDIPMILCSGYSRMISEEKASEIGISAYIRKPFVKNELLKTIRNLLDK